MDLKEVAVWLERLARLDSRVFEEVRSNPAATIPSILIATVSMLIAGVGGWLWWMLQDFGTTSSGISYSISSGDILLNSALIGSLIAALLWGLAWLGVVYFMLTQVFRQRAYVEQLLRVMGLAATPLALMGFMFIPAASFGIGLAALVLAFGLTAIAISSVTTADPIQIMVANAAGFLVWAIVLTFLAGSSEPMAPGIFLFQTTTEAFSDFFSFT